MNEPDFGFYARALRVLGQDLADLLPENLAIKMHGEEFRADGFRIMNRTEASESAASSFAGMKGLIDKITAALNGSNRRPGVELVPFSRTYSSRDIDRLDAEASSQRKDIRRMPDIYSLGERLRTIGAVIDGRKGRVVGIFKDLHRIVSEYQDGSGKVYREQLTNSELYQLQRRYADERGYRLGDKAG